MERVEDHLAAAEEALRQGQARRGMEHAQAALGLQLGNGRAYALIGLAHTMMGEEVQARSALLQAAELWPLDSPVRYYSYLALARLRDLDGARAQLAYFTQLDPKNEPARAQLARMGGPPPDLAPLPRQDSGAVWFDAGGRALADAGDISRSLMEDAEPPPGPDVIVCPDCEKRTYKGIVCRHCGTLLPRD